MESSRLIRSGVRAFVVNRSCCQSKSFIPRRFSVSPTRIPSDPLVHSESPDQDVAEEATKAEAAKEHRRNEPIVDTDPLVPPKPLVSPSSKLEHTLNQPVIPTTQQKRHVTSNTSKSPPPSLDDVACIGMDGSPWPEREEEKLMGKQRREQEEDDKEYFKHHKASPLSEIEVADTRKPISKATDGTAYAGGGGGGLVLFSEEQRDSAEDSLKRATEIWWEAKVRGDPDSPHGRVLRTLRGENW